MMFVGDRIKIRQWSAMWNYWAAAIGRGIAYERYWGNWNPLPNQDWLID